MKQPGTTTMDWDPDILCLRLALAAWWAGQVVHDPDGENTTHMIERVRQRAQRAKDRWQFALVLREELWTLGDGHLGLDVDWPPAVEHIRSGVDLVDTPEGVALAGGAERIRARQPINAGDLAVSVDGAPIADYLQRARRMPGSTAAHRRWQSVLSLIWQQRLPDESDPPSTIGFKGPTGPYNVQLLWEAAPVDVASPQCVTGRVVFDGVALLRVTSFLCRDERGQVSDGEFARQARAAAAALEGSTDVIIDLRWNGGGRDEQARLLAEMCIGEPIVWMRYRHRIPGTLARGTDTASLIPHRESPLSTARLWVLTSPVTASTAEIFAAALVGAERAMLVGEATAGCVGNPVRFRLPVSGLGVNIPVTEYVSADGLGHEGRGLEPGIAAPMTADDLRRGGDPGVDAVLRAR